jgi:hypothetical protein
MITLINKATTIGESDGVSITQSQEEGQINHSFQVIATGNPTAVTIQIDGTLDGTNYSELLTHDLTSSEITAQIAIIHLINKTVPRIKAIINTLDGGTNPTVSVYYFKGR